MKYARMLSVIAAGLLASTAAIAQTSTTTTTQTTVTTEQVGKVKTYVMKEKKPSVRITEQLAVGAALPSSVEFYSFPADVGVTNYRYTVVNDKTVLVDPSSRKIIQIIE